LPALISCVSMPVGAEHKDSPPEGMLREKLPSVPVVVPVFVPLISMLMLGRG